MRKNSTFLLVFLLNALVILSAVEARAQSPQAIPYQAVARNASGNLLANQNISLRISIHDGTAGGTVVYQETQTTSTNTLGLFNIIIGQGTVVIGIFSNINWGNGNKFIQTEIDITGGNTYSNMGTTQLQSVPYSLYSLNGTPGPQGLTGAAGAGYIATSVSSNTIGLGSKTFVTQSGLAYLANTRVRVSNNSTNYVEGILTSYSDSTLIVNVDRVIGSGTFDVWNIGIAGDVGATGGYPVHFIGESYGGGIVFFVYDNGQHGLIAAPANQSSAVVLVSGFIPNFQKADGINAGRSNTIRLCAKNEAFSNNFAPQLCVHYQGGNFGDWYLPSKYELNLLYLQKTIVGGFTNSGYWSSTTGFGDGACWTQNFSNGSQTTQQPSTTLAVRCIRAF